MKLFLAYAVAVLAVCWGVASHVQGIEDEGRAERAQQQLDIARSNFATELTEAKKTADTIFKSTPQVLIRRDSVLKILTDTVAVKEYIYQTDTLREACLSCAARIFALDSLRADERRAADRFTGALQSQIASLKREKFLDRFGFSCGYGATVVASEVRVGPQCGASIRILP